MAEPVKVVLVGDAADTRRDELLRHLTRPRPVVAVPEEAPRETLAQALQDAEIVVTSVWGSRRPPAPRLRLLQSASAGTELIKRAALPPGVTVCNVFGHEVAIGEYAVLGMLAWTQRLIAVERSFRAGSWQRDPLHDELFGKTIGILGLGRIGREVAQRAKAFATQVLAVNRSAVERPPFVDELHPMSQLDAVLPRCDFLVVCCALTPETAGLIDARRLALMRREAVILNVARGPVIDEAALYDALRQHVIAGAVIDTWYRYPAQGDANVRPSRYPFHELPNLIMTPHHAGWTTQMVERRWSAIARNIERFADGLPPENVVFTT